MKKLDDRLELFLKDIFNKNYFENFIDNNINFDDLINNPKKTTKKISFLSSVSKDKLYQHVIIFRQQKLLYDENILNLFRFKIIDFLIIIFLSYLVYFGLDNLIHEIETFYKLAAPKRIFIVIGCLIFSLIMYIPLKQFLKKNITFYLLLLFLYIFVLILGAIIPEAWLYITLLSFLLVVFCYIIYFQK